MSILEVGEGLIEVKSTNGDTHLGGDDWDERIVRWMLDEFKKQQGIDLSAEGSAERCRGSARQPRRRKSSSPR